MKSSHQQFKIQHGNAVDVVINITAYNHNIIYADNYTDTSKKIKQN